MNIKGEDRSMYLDFTGMPMPQSGGLHANVRMSTKPLWIALSLVRKLSQHQCAYTSSFHKNVLKCLRHSFITSAGYERN